MNKITIVLICTICATIMCGCIGTTYSEHELDSSKYGTGIAVITDHEMTKDPVWGYWLVEGNVRNNGKSMLECADIKVTFYDKYKTVIGTREGHVYEIWPDETDDFSITYQRPNKNSGIPVSYTIKLVHPIYDNRE